MLACEPELLLFDEPTAGMSSEQVPELINIINRIVQQRERTAILVEHRMDMVMSISDVVTVMNQGRILAEGSPGEIASNKQVQIAYLGDLYGELALTKIAHNLRISSSLRIFTPISGNFTSWKAYLSGCPGVRSQFYWGGTVPGKQPHSNLFWDLRHLKKAG
jgi:ABC-type dipeptide/oligopeptide/nickel transport system ATPase component